MAIILVWIYINKNYVTLHIYTKKLRRQKNRDLRRRNCTFLFAGFLSALSLLISCQLQTPVFTIIMGFGDLKSDVGVTALNEYLADKSYIEGCVRSS